MLQSASVAKCKCCKVQVLQSANVAKCKCCKLQVANGKVASNIASAKCNFKLGYPQTDRPTHARTGGLLELLSQLKKRVIVTASVGTLLYSHLGMTDDLQKKMAKRMTLGKKVEMGTCHDFFCG